MSVILLRHTRPEGAQGLCYGRTDLDLAEGFEADVARLIGELPLFDRIVSSPLSRCKRLADAIGAERQIAVKTDDRLIEMDFGAWENRLWDDIPRAQIDDWMHDFSRARPHGGETVAELAERVSLGLNALAADGKRVLVVTHSGVIKAAMVSKGHSEGWQLDTPFGTWLRWDAP